MKSVPNAFLINVSYPNMSANRISYILQEKKYFKTPFDHFFKIANRFVDFTSLPCSAEYQLFAGDIGVTCTFLYAPGAAPPGAVFPRSAVTCARSDSAVAPASPDRSPVSCCKA